MKQRGAGFQKPLSPEACSPVKVPVLRTNGETITVNCGWAKQHPRKKVREDAAQRHLDKKHGGRGMWLG